MSLEVSPPHESHQASREDECPAADGTKSEILGLRSHNIVVDGKRTSIRLDPFSLEAMDEIAKNEHFKSVNELYTLIDKRNKGSNLTFSAAVRLFLLTYYRKIATEDGHKLIGHGLSRVLKGTPFDESVPLKIEEPKQKRKPGRPPKTSKAVPSSAPQISLCESLGQDSAAS